MAEREFDLRPVGVDYVCDDCTTGIMEPTGTVLTTIPYQWPHKCNHCGAVKNLAEKYPTVRYKRAEGW